MRELVELGERNHALPFFLLLLTPGGFFVLQRDTPAEGVRLLEGSEHDRQWVIEITGAAGTVQTIEAERGGQRWTEVDRGGQRAELKPPFPPLPSQTNQPAHALLEPRLQ